MNICLSNFFKIAEIKSFDRVSGQLKPVVRLNREDIAGWFAHQDHSLFALYKADDELQLFLDGTHVTLNKHLRTQLDDDGSYRHFQAFFVNALIFEKRYPAKPNSDGNPFWPSDPEDEDAVLMIHNVANSKERQDSIRCKLTFGSS